MDGAATLPGGRGLSLGGGMGVMASAQFLPGVMLGSPEAWNKGSDTRIIAVLRAGSLGLSTSSQYVSSGAGPGETEGMRPGGGMQSSRAWAGVGWGFCQRAGSQRWSPPGGLAEDLKLRWLPGEGGEQGTGRGRSWSQRLKSQGIPLPPAPRVPARGSREEGRGEEHPISKQARRGWGRGGQAAFWANRGTCWEIAPQRPQGLRAALLTSAVSAQMTNYFLEF